MSKTSGHNAFIRLDAHYRLYIALAVAIVTFFCARTSISAPGMVLLTWSSFAFTTIVMEWVVILSSHPRDVRQVASLEDTSRTLIFIFVVLAALASLVAIIFLLKSSKQGTDAQITGHVLLSMGAVVISWWLVHSIFCMRYAHLYYTTEDGKKKPVGGLEFPNEDEPDYLDFVYFSFVLGTTFQVSDVEISSRSIRRLAFLHGLVSFIYNTAILALSINIISGFISK